jgi:hypothetical protein
LYHIYSLLHKTHLYASICTIYTLYNIKPTSMPVNVWYFIYSL